MIEILKICSPYPAMATLVYELMQFRTLHIAVCFFSRSNCFESILKYIYPLSVVRKFLDHPINDQNQETDTLRVAKLPTTVQMTIWQRVHHLVI